MFGFFFAIFMALACPAHNHNTHCNNGGQATTQGTGDTGGDGSHIPPPPPPPPPH